MHTQKRLKVEFGDFQTPVHLTQAICSLIARTGFRPASILEPTCGTGSFLRAALETFPYASRVLGFEINPQYVAQARYTLTRAFPGAPVEVHQADFFHTNWDKVLETLPEPLLVLGNPPWATNAALGRWGGSNLPTKTNLDKLPGIVALTGKSNFDISEWMLRQNLKWLNGKNGLLAMLCKTTVARKVLFYAWRNGFQIEWASIYIIDAQEHFKASVDACLLLVRTHPTGNAKACRLFRSLYAQEPDGSFALQDGMLVADVRAYLKWKDLKGTGLSAWRSGIKHDCGDVFELRIENGNFVNGLGEIVDVEPEVLFPLLKSSDLAAGKAPSRWLLVPQRGMNDDPDRLKVNAPKAWNYLNAHAHLLDNRRSSVYKNRPRFSVFGVGPYSFAPWKIAISGLYKKLAFVRVSPFQGKPVVLDDTCYFLPCRSEAECDLLYELVTSEPAVAFWSALIFWDAKRPITAQILNALDLSTLVRILGKENDAARTLVEQQRVACMEDGFLFGEKSSDCGDEPVVSKCWQAFSDNRPAGVGRWLASCNVSAGK